MPEVTEHHGDLDGQPVFWRQAGEVPILYLHGVPTSSDDWLPFLPQTGGIAPDLPGFGRSGKRGDLAFDLPFYDAWIERFLDMLGLERVSLVLHDWGALGLLWAQRFPERVERLVLIDAVPLLPGFRWHLAARLWRTRGVGEVAIGLTVPWTMRRFGVPAEVAAGAALYLDQGTQRAILRLFRAADPGVLAAAGERLGLLLCPSLVIWGAGDRVVASTWADVYGATLPRAEVRHLDAGHWPWTERPEVVTLVDGFLHGR